jgi:hypothetical protein
MIRPVRYPVCRGAGKETAAATVFLCKDYLIEQLNAWIIRRLRFALMQEFVERCNED